MKYSPLILAAFSLLTGSGGLLAQEAPPTPLTTGQSFLVEWGGGAVGSAIGGGIGFLIASESDCPTEELACSFEKAGIALAASAVGSGAGTWLAGRMGDTEPSGLGAAIGALLGVPAGIGVVHLLSEDTEWVRNDAALFASYALTQGIVSAIGSRIVASLRD
jgi:hypothetical protein